MTHFTEDWIVGRVNTWPVDHLKGRAGVTAMEIGCFEGRCTTWLLENVLTGDGSKIYCLDPWGAKIDYYYKDASPAYGRFIDNIAPWRDRVRIRRGFSQQILRTEQFDPLDLVFIDGSHRACDALEDAVLVWPCVKPGGVVVFDDYQWHEPKDRLEEVWPAVDAFVDLYSRQLEVVFKGWQWIVRKL
jgi:predicted O-methyltransferase YrrM